MNTRTLGEINANLKGLIMKPTRLVRLSAFLIDYLLVCFLVVGLSFLWVWDIVSKSPMSTEDFYEVQRINYFSTGIGLLITIFKDVFKGRSIGKRLIQLSIRDNKNIEQVPNVWRLILRNVTILIWPVEIIFFLIRGRRIGDVLFKTQVITTNRDLQVNQ